jgi:hypothetical protein
MVLLPHTQAQLIYTGTIRRWYYYLVGFIQKADSMSYPQGISVIRATALWEFIRLHILQSDDGLCHYASVPVFAVTLLSFALERTVLCEKDKYYVHFLQPIITAPPSILLYIYSIYLNIKWLCIWGGRWLQCLIFNKNVYFLISHVLSQFVCTSHFWVKCESWSKD